MKPFHVRGTERAVQVVKINFDGDLFFTGSQDGLISCWLLESGERYLLIILDKHLRLGNFKTNTAVKTLDITDNSKYLVCGSLEVRPD
jgi:translation initiation factor 3 subunit I